MTGTEWVPTLSELEYAWIMRQAELDEAAALESDPLRYAAEFRGAFRNVQEAAWDEGWDARDSVEHGQPEDFPENPYRKGQAS